MKRKELFKLAEKHFNGINISAIPDKNIRGLENYEGGFVEIITTYGNDGVTGQLVRGNRTGAHWYANKKLISENEEK